MDEPSQVRRAAWEAVGGTTPERLRTHIFDTLDRGSMAPGVLTLLSARAASEGGKNESGDRDDTLARRAAGVQLIYDGLRVTRTLAHEEPWTDEDGDRTAADIAILAADVLVARGFHLLARTEVAPRTVETIRRFGRDQARRIGSATSDASDSDTTDTDADAGDRTVDRNLEADALDLAVRCGVTAVGTDVPTDLSAFAADLATTVDSDGFPPVEGLFTRSVLDDLAVLVGERERKGVSGGVSPTTDG